MAHTEYTVKVKVHNSRAPKASDLEKTIRDELKLAHGDNAGVTVKVVAINGVNRGVRNTSVA
jgi:hypothetical protein